jgi:hypothetical protein
MYDRCYVGKEDGNEFVEENYKLSEEKALE